MKNFDRHYIMITYLKISFSFANVSSMTCCRFSFSSGFKNTSMIGFKSSGASCFGRLVDKVGSVDVLLSLRVVLVDRLELVRPATDRVGSVDVDVFITVVSWVEFIDRLELVIPATDREGSVDVDVFITVVSLR